jgi:hypothetical protein
LPITIDPHSSPGIVCVRYTAPFTFAEWCDVADRLRADLALAFDPNLGLLIDRTAVRRPEGWFIKGLVDYLASHKGFMRGRRIAIVVSDADAAQSAWMQAMLYEDAGAVSSVFTTIRAAEAWLRQR